MNLGEVEGCLCNVTSDEDIEIMFNKAISFFSHLDGVINNAGLGGESSLENMTNEAWNLVLDVTLNGAMKVYVDAYASDSTDVLVGYKGTSEADAAAFYCPYIPLMSSGVVLDPSSFEPVVSFMTRYGYVELNNTASSLGNAADYLARVSVANVTFS